MANFSHELMTSFSPRYMSLFFSLEIYHESQKLLSLKKKKKNPTLPAPCRNQFNETLILLLALFSRAFLAYLRPDRLDLCKYGWSYLMLVLSPSIGCWLVEPKNELGDKTPWA